MRISCRLTSVRDRSRFAKFAGLDSCHGKILWIAFLDALDKFRLQNSGNCWGFGLFFEVGICFGRRFRCGFGGNWWIIHGSSMSGMRAFEILECAVILSTNMEGVMTKLRVLWVFQLNCFHWKRIAFLLYLTFASGLATVAALLYVRKSPHTFFSEPFNFPSKIFR